MARCAVGRTGEDLAAAALEVAGLRIVVRNWRPALARTRQEVRGELDIVAIEGDVLVFCEVKTRRGWEDPLVAVTPAKLRALRRLAHAYLAETGHRGPVRFDVVGVRLPPGGEPEFHYVRGV